MRQQPNAAKVETSERRKLKRAHCDRAHNVQIKLLFWLAGKKWQRRLIIMIVTVFATSLFRLSRHSSSQSVSQSAVMVQLLLDGRLLSAPLATSVSAMTTTRTNWIQLPAELAKFKSVGKLAWRAAPAQPASERAALTARQSPIGQRASARVAKIARRRSLILNELLAAHRVASLFSCCCCSLISRH